MNHMLFKNERTEMNCEYCGSRIFESDRVCDRCGAPNKNHFEKRQETYGEYFREIERNSPRMPSLTNITSASWICW